MSPHVQDSDCTVDQDTGCCVECGVGHQDEPCPDCGQRAFHRDECPQARLGVRSFEQYILPDGEEVNVDASASKGDRVIDFQLRGGQIVKAIRKGAA